MAVVSQQVSKLVKENKEQIDIEDINVNAILTKHKEDKMMDVLVLFFKANYIKQLLLTWFENYFKVKLLKLVFISAAAKGLFNLLLDFPIGEGSFIRGFQIL